MSKKGLRKIVVEGETYYWKFTEKVFISKNAEKNSILIVDFGYYDFWLYVNSRERPLDYEGVLVTPQFVRASILIALGQGWNKGKMELDYIEGVYQLKTNPLDIKYRDYRTWVNLDEAYYIVNYFGSLLTEEERLARTHLMYIVKLKSTDEYDSIEQYNRRKKWFLDRKLITEDESILKLLEQGDDFFIRKTAERIIQDYPYEIVLNRCPKCNYVARTPKAKQCRKCFYQWHDVVS